MPGHILKKLQGIGVNGQLVLQRSLKLCFLHGLNIMRIFAKFLCHFCWHDWPVANCRPLQLLIICPPPRQGRAGPGAGQRKYNPSFISTFTMLYQLAAEPRNLEHRGCCEPRICSSREQIFYSKRKPSTLENKYWDGMVDGSLYWEWNLSEVSEKSVNQGGEPLKWFI